MTTIPGPAGRWLAMALAGGLAAAPLSAQTTGQSFEVRPLRDSVTVGDTITLGLRVRLHERDKMIDSLPSLIGPPLQGTRVLSVAPLARGSDRVYTGLVQVAFYRPGRQPLPRFGVAYARIIQNINRAVLPSDPGSIEIVPTLPPGEQKPKDIRPLEHQRWSPWPWLAAAALGLGTFWAVTRRRSAAGARPEAAPAPAPGAGRRTPLDVAAERLREIEAEQWPARGNIDHHYHAVVDVMRDFLAESRQIPAREMTSSELRRALSLTIPAGAELDRSGRFLEQADLVKFAGARPGVAAAGEYLESARTLLAAWGATHTNGRG